MASWDDVRQLVRALPETEERTSGQGDLQWRVREKLLLWERPLRRGDLEALGEHAPDGPVLAAHLPDLGAKEALLATSPEIYFTTPHFDDYPAILVRLSDIALDELRELVVEAWLDRAPKRLVKEYLEGS